MLRADRAEQHEPVEHENDLTPVLAFWQYLGSGYLNPGDVLQAVGVEDSLRAAREALQGVERRGPRPPGRIVNGALCGELVVFASEGLVRGGQRPVSDLSGYRPILF